MAATGMQNVRGQTAAQPVSLANCGRAVSPNHPQYSNKAVPGNEQMFFPDHPATNAYTHDLAGSFQQQQFQYPFHNPNGSCYPSLDVGFHHGLPSSTEPYSNIPVFAEPLEYTHISPVTLNSSFSSSVGSSIASERMASMTLEPGTSQGSMPPMDFSGNHHHVSSTGIRGQSWVGNCPATISPKMLRIDASPTPTSSSEPLQTAVQAAVSDSDLGPSACGQYETCSALLSEHSDHKARKELPTKPTKPRLASSSPTTHREHVSSKGKSKVHAHQHSHQPPLRCLTKAAPAGLVAHQRAAEVDDPADIASPALADAERDAKNRFLVESKRAGMTYREIRRRGGFAEAESTLRGRFRTLTKNKEQRVRKPEWQEEDIRLLKKAVRKLAQDDKTSAKVPWKQVATYIYEHGGSYHFGNATCRKKWDELVEQGIAELP
ncbi:hypothetical protein F4802DRAFT_604842 [Xylaria palmicola]|nr:hypothetical protein F4802DRAFT_604842 [Xylaria palmicola]